MGISKQKTLKAILLLLIAVYDQLNVYGMEKKNSHNLQSVFLQLIARKKVTLSYPLFFDWVRKNVISPSSQESLNNIGVFDKDGNEVAQLVGNESFVWDIKGIQDNPYILISCSSSLEGNRGKVISWNLATRTQIAQYQTKENTFLLSVLGYKNRSEQYIIAAAGGFNKPVLYLLNALTGEYIKECKGGHTKALFSVQKLNGANWFASMQLGGEKIGIWDFEGNNQRMLQVSDEFIHHYSPVFALLHHHALGAFVISHGKKELMHTGYWERIRFWRQQDNFTPYAAWEWNDLMTALRVTEDNKYLATGGLLGTLVLWKVNQITDATTTRYTGHTSKINDIQFISPQKLMLSVSGNDDSASSTDISVRVWDFEGNQLAYVSPSSLIHELQYIQLTQDGDLVIASCAGDLFFFKLTDQPSENKSADDKDEQSDQKRGKKISGRNTMIKHLIIEAQK